MNTNLMTVILTTVLAMAPCSSLASTHSVTKLSSKEDRVPLVVIRPLLLSIVKKVDKLSVAAIIRQTDIKWLH